MTMINSLRNLLVIIALLMPVTASAQLETPPPAGEPKNFVLPATTDYELTNGMKVTLVPFGSVPKFSLSLRVRAGNLNEGDDTWLSDLLGALMEEGAGDRDALALAQAASDMGGSVGVAVGVSATTVGMSALSEFAADAVGLVADVVRRPQLPQGELARIKADFSRNLSIALSSPGSLAGALYSRALYGDHTYGRSFPTAAQLESYSYQAIVDFHAREFGAKRSHIYVVGQFDEADVRAAIEGAFGDWQEGPEAIENPVDPQAPKTVYLLDRPDASQTTLRLGRPVMTNDDPDWVAFGLMNTLLGGSFTSRITSNIREDKGYTYSPSSSVSTLPGAASWQQGADVTTDVTGAALTEIFKEIETLRNEVPEADELDGFKRYRAGILTLQNASRGGVLGQLAYLDLYGLPRTRLEEFVDNVYGTTPEDISRLVREELTPGMTLVAVGDLSIIRSQLEAVPQLADYEFVTVTAEELSGGF